MRDSVKETNDTKFWHDLFRSFCLLFIHPWKDDPQNGIKIIGKIYSTTPYHIHRYLPSNLKTMNHGWKVLRFNWLTLYKGIPWYIRKFNKCKIMLNVKLLAILVFRLNENNQLFCYSLWLSVVVIRHIPYKLSFIVSLKRLILIFDTYACHVYSTGFHKVWKLYHLFLCVFFSLSLPPFQYLYIYFLL